MRLFALKVPETTLDRLLHHLPEAAQERVRKFRHEGDAIPPFASKGHWQLALIPHKPNYPCAPLPRGTMAALTPGSVAGRLLPTWYLRSAGLLSGGTYPRFGAGERGKPFLADPVVPGGIDFNTSHEGAYVLLAVVRGSVGAAGVAPEVGVDVMDLPTDPDALAHDIEYQLTRDEQLALAGTRGRIKAKLLTTLWTVKEGYTKAIGVGVSFGLDRIAVNPGDGAVSSVRVNGRDIRLDGWSWAVGSLEGGSYGYAVIWRGDEDTNVRPEPEHIAWDDFVRAFIGQPATPP